MAKVLVIEDDAAMRQTIVRALADIGCQVVEATDGRDGMRKFHADTPDVVITDILMPEQEGIQTIGEIRAASATVGVIAISGGGSRDASLYLTIAEEIGADAVLQKPFRLAELTAIVERLLARDPPVRGIGA